MNIFECDRCGGSFAGDSVEDVGDNDGSGFKCYECLEKEREEN